MVVAWHASYDSLITSDWKLKETMGEEERRDALSETGETGWDRVKVLLDTR